jgi:cystathionine beta-lyase/cystathionine gamma-synthase
MTKSKNGPNHGVNTRLAHGGYDPRSFHGFVNPPVVHASTVLFPDAETIETRNQPYTYGTYGTPTTDALNARRWMRLRALPAPLQCLQAWRRSHCPSCPR